MILKCQKNNNNIAVNGRNYYFEDFLQIKHAMIEIKVALTAKLFRLYIHQLRHSHTSQTHTQ